MDFSIITDIADSILNSGLITKIINIAENAGSMIFDIVSSIFGTIAG